MLPWSPQLLSKYLLDPLKVFLEAFLFENIRKSVQLIFFFEETDFFFEKKCVLNNFLSVTEMIQ